MTTTVTMHVYNGVITQEEASITFPTDRLDIYNDINANWIWVPYFQDGIDYNVWLNTGIFVQGTNTSLRYRLNIFNSEENTSGNNWTFS